MWMVVKAFTKRISYDITPSSVCDRSAVFHTSDVIVKYNFYF
jgi:hypothetical protein